MPGAVFLRGERVALRTVEEEDLPFLTGWANDEATRRATGGQTFPTSRERERDDLDAAADEGAVVLLVCPTDGDADDPVGAVELDPVDDATGTAHLGYWVVPERRREGFAREAVALAVTYAFDERRMHRVTAEVFAFNDGSRRLLDALGFTHEGTVRENYFFDGRYWDTHVYGVLADEWDPD